LQLIDYIIISIYFAVTLSIGAYLSKRQTLQHDFFLAGRSMHWFPIGLSVMVTAFSAINYTAFSGEVFSHGLYVLLCLPVFAIISLPVTRVIMPFYDRMGVCSAYEYLEKRFDVRVRCLASGLFIVWRIFWMATALYVPSTVLNKMTGLNLYGLILLIGAVTTAYAAAGGIKAVMWSDVFQFFVLFGGVILSLVFATLHTPDGFGGMLRQGAAQGILKPFYPFDPQIFSPDPSIRITLWSCLIGSFTAFLARYGVDQVVVQRYFTARSLKDARLGFHLNYVAAILSLLMLALMGFAIHSHATNAGILGKLGTQPVSYFWAFVQSLPAGMTGVIGAGLFAASMSSLDSGINSCCTAFMTDFYNRFSGKRKAEESARNRLLTVIFGIFITGAAMTVGRLGSIFEIANKIINGFGSPLLAVFLLGLFSRRANSRGMFFGGLLGACWSAYVSFTVENLALHYYAVVNLVGTLFLCYFFSLLENLFFSEPSSMQLAWAWQGVMKNAPNEASRSLLR
jgi:SSS family transporter